MVPHLAFLLIFLIFFMLHFLIERALALINSRFVYAHRETVPPAVKDTISMETYARSIQYALTRARFGHVTSVYGAGLKLFFLFSGILLMLDEWLRPLPFGELGRGVALIMAFFIIRNILDLPFDLYSTFRIESRFGFNKTTVKTFWMDQVKGFILSMLIGIPFQYAILLFIVKGGSYWWLWASVFVITFQIVMMIAYPILIAPLFNKFTPLQDGELKNRLVELAQRCQFAARGIFVVDGSKRSTHSNAYFTGIGNSRRIVLFDTLIEQMNIDELAAVLAHEIGHYKRKHILQRLALTIVMTPVAFYILGLLVNWKPMYEAFSMGSLFAPSVPPERHVAIGVLLFSMIAGDFTFWVGPFFSFLSRKHEYEADAYAAQQTSAAPMASALMKLSEKNLSTLLPHPAYSAYHYSHPTLLERLGALKQFT
jgi:STE24 endopeptidase